ncbi:MAG TPA: endonuclease V [Gaiellaceae bacterium]|nr:endonuclease V [Gaiellaceae bacterium]
MSEHFRTAGESQADWPTSAKGLEAEQLRLREARPPPWRPGGAVLLYGGCFVCFERCSAGPGRPSERAWAGAALVRRGRTLAAEAVEGLAPAAYEAGLLALREGALLEAAVRALPEPSDVLLVNATGRDHPRRAGLAVHLGALLDLPTVGVTHRPLLAAGDWPADRTGATAPLELEGEVVGAWVRTRAGTRPLAVHAGWRTEASTAAAVVLAAGAGVRTPEALRQARRVARSRRAAAQ